MSLPPKPTWSEGRHPAIIDAMDDADAPAVYAAFRARTLPKAQWTHEAHLVVCWSVLRRHDPDRALDLLRDAIRAYNDATGTPNTDTSGYHETLTCYYIGAVAALSGRPLAAVIASESCARSAPTAHWSRELLFGTRARRAWVAPDIAALPWPVPGDVAITARSDVARSGPARP